MPCCMSSNVTFFLVRATALRVAERCNAEDLSPLTVPERFREFMSAIPGFNSLDLFELLRTIMC